MWQSGKKKVAESTVCNGEGHGYKDEQRKYWKMNNHIKA